jgi:endo-1,4-beta-xylanase
MVLDERYHGAKFTSPINNLTDIPMGISISYDLMKNDPTYTDIVKSEFDNVTFEYQMKQGAMVRNDGSIDFTNTYELVNLIGGNVYGHVLVCQ